MALYTIYEFMKKVGVNDVSLIADMENHGFLTPANQTLAGTRYYSKQQVKNFEYLYSLYVDFCRKQANKKNLESEPIVTVVGQSVIPALKPVAEDLASTKTYTEYTYTVKVVEPTCTTKGYTEHICNENKLKSYKDTEVAALGHDYVKTIEEATCQKEGKESETCSRCGHTRSNVIKAIGHNYQEYKKIQATCSMAGSEEYKCAICGDIKNTPIPALGHTFEEVILQAGSCTEDRITKKVCSMCQEETPEETIAATGHSIITEVVNVTCMEDGYTKHTCEKCDYVDKTDIIPATGHDFVEEIEYEATEETPGKKMLTCSTCGYQTSEEIPCLPPATTSVSNMLKALQKMQSENELELQKGEEEARLYEEKVNSYTGPMTVQGKKRTF